ncbi:hypothetical protein NQ314_016412 [Rhamnusium bicolor]|uniref:PiggyBac transposable element-derived protein domain-containing protein n=1 Tax=Rhamnusium bicolor TaxID=1586634 RepID=A0AAV8WWV7_9CUCU|nr:hypothetical protein NQ314_016412 [Rhamnusium bicolor]
MTFRGIVTWFNIDEQPHATKYRHYIKQYLPAKPYKRGYKLYMLCGTDGFSYKFEIYIGDENNPKYRKPEEPDLGSSANIVLAVHLVKYGILCPGTMRRSRIPHCKLPSDKEMAKEKRGTSEEFVAN